LQTNKSNAKKDSIKVAVKDMDNATIKMIEGKKAKEELKYIKLALLVCDSIKEQQNKKDLLQEAVSVGLKQQNNNLNKIVEDMKIIAKNEKSAGLRRGFFGFIKGFGVGLAVTGAFFLFVN
jgi:uncharacterized protein (UPF0210 family)